MKTNKRLIAPATMLFGSMVAAVAFAMPASAADSVYPPRAGTEVLGTSASTTERATATDASRTPLFRITPRISAPFRQAGCINPRPPS